MQLDLSLALETKMVSNDQELVQSDSVLPLKLKWLVMIRNWCNQTQSLALETKMVSNDQELVQSD